MTDGKGVRYKYVWQDELLPRLSPEAASLIASGAVYCNIKTASKLKKRGDAYLAELSRKIACALPGQSVEDIMDSLSKQVPTKSIAWQSVIVRDDSFSKAAGCDEVYKADVPEWIETFAIAHGWHNSQECLDAIDSWKEAKRAWESFKSIVLETWEAEKCQ